MIHCGTAYFDNIILDHFERDMDEIMRQGCDFVVLTYSEQNHWYHEGQFRKLVAAAKTRGLTVFVDPWSVGGVFGGETLTHRPMWAPDERQVRSDGLIVPALCLTSPALMAYLKSWIDSAVTLKPDYLLWDEPHFYLNWWDSNGPLKTPKGAWSCRCKTCRKMFKEEFGKAMPTSETDEVKTFKLRRIRDFLATLMAYAGKKSTKNCLGLFPQHASILPTESDWFFRDLVTDRNCHLIGGEAYFDYQHNRPDDVYAHAVEQTRLMKRWADFANKELVMWAMAFRIPKGFENDLAAALKGCAVAGADWVGAWGFDACSHVSAIACERPEKVWSLMGKTFHALRSSRRSRLAQRIIPKP
ncbi:MAG: hypothetical protein ACOYNN_13755 [Terrimicrobiaceae bacterium]